mgnify:CR=1 FL=1
MFTSAGMAFSDTENGGKPTRFPDRRPTVFLVDRVQRRSYHLGT